MQAFLLRSKALADASRLRALMAIRDDELCLCQLIDVLELSPATVSKHMQVLHGAGLVERRKEGRWHFYRLAGADAATEVRRTLSAVVEELRDDPAVRADDRRVRRTRRRDLEELSACYRS